MKILILDDNVELSKLTKIALEKDHYEVVICNDATDGIDYVRTHQPDLILIDVIMPEMSGPDIVKYLKMDPIFKDIPVIFLTGLVPTAQENSQNEGVIIDGVQYPTLGKPYRSEELLNVIKQHIGE